MAIYSSILTGLVKIPNHKILKKVKVIWWDSVQTRFSFHGNWLEFEKLEDVICKWQFTGMAKIWTWDYCAHILQVFRAEL